MVFGQNTWSHNFDCKLIAGSFVNVHYHGLFKFLLLTKKCLSALNDVTHSETLFFSFLFDASENKTNNFTRLQIYFKEKKLWGLVIEIGLGQAPVFSSFEHAKNC